MNHHRDTAGSLYGQGRTRFNDKADYLRSISSNRYPLKTVFQRCYQLGLDTRVLLCRTGSCDGEMVLQAMFASFSL